MLKGSLSAASGPADQLPPGLTRNRRKEASRDPDVMMHMRHRRQRPARAAPRRAAGFHRYQLVGR